MAQRVIIPRMGQTMTEGLIAKWYVKDGAAVKEGDDIYELEYDKSISTVQARVPGIVRVLYEEGAVVPLGEAVAVILEKGEAFDPSMAKGAHSVANAAQKSTEAGRSGLDGPAAAGTAFARAEGTVLATPYVRSLARKMGVDIQALAAPGERVTKEDLENYMQKPARLTPLAGKIAEEMDLDLSLIKPKDGKLITKDDLIAQTGRKKKGRAVLRGRREQMRGIRKVIADNMTKSYFTYPTVTLTTDADMSALLELREQINEELEHDGIKLTITDMLIKAVARALVENEIVNTSLSGEEIVYHEQVNIGMAVALPKGLVVPVIYNADKLSLIGIAEETKRLADLAKSGGLGGDDMSGGTFTITNLGSFGIDSFNPIINYPESAILGIGRTVKKPVVVDDEIVIRSRAVLSFTHDHRVIDGAPGAYFLQSVVRYIEKPFLLLMDL